MNDERITILRTLGFFSISTLYLNLVSTLSLGADLSDVEINEGNRKTIIIAGTELANIPRQAIENIQTLLTKTPNLHPTDVTFFNDLKEGYEILGTLGELLLTYIDDYFDEEEEDSVLDFQEYCAISQNEIMKIVKKHQ